MCGRGFRPGDGRRRHGGVRSELLASPLFSPAWLRWRKSGSDNHCSVNSVRSIRPSIRRARDRPLPGPAAASLRRIVDGSTAPASIEALRRMSSCHWPMIERIPATRKEWRIRTAPEGVSNGAERRLQIPRLVRAARRSRSSGRRRRCVSPVSAVLRVRSVLAARLLKRAREPEISGRCARKFGSLRCCCHNHCGDRRREGELVVLERNAAGQQHRRVSRGGQPYKSVEPRGKRLGYM